MPTLHIHLDESGNFTFSPKGTKYYIFAVAWTFNPQALATSLINLRFKLLKQGHDLPFFHAAPDRQVNRDAVISTITAHDDWKWVAVVIEKSKVNPTLREPHKFYPKFAAIPLRFVLRGRRDSSSKVMVYTDKLPVKKHRESVEKTIKAVCRYELPSGVPFCIYHHPSMSNTWLQIADYCAWALARKWEIKDERTYSTLKENLEREELDALRGGDCHYY